ncbi:hypothetical protein G5C51_15130 [Streptomyces sp. A7024]|uniref:Uncharacterized protein n=1 Tax=Streptomyces coryli TaxID=1128680 RepID=A0A6G4U1R8_9ACTN|nr:hypothetical protein [Streptomyces coryli]NGN65227.1 hypothetical protein [Streptomyces coryli]
MDLLVLLVVLAAATALPFGLNRLRKRAGWRRPRIVTCAVPMVAGLLLGAAVYTYGMTFGDTADPVEFCASHGVGQGRIDVHDEYPLGVRCVAPDGRGVELLPWWVNPAVLATAALFCASFVAMTGARAKKS